VQGACEEAERLGYKVVVLDDAVTGEARSAARAWIERARVAAAGAAEPLCIVSAGETTVRVTGVGKGGRNQEFALAAAEAMASWSGAVIAASVGTDGIDGPTSAAGALVDSTTTARAQAMGLPPVEGYLAANDSYTFFHALGDLVQTGRTDTNVGDLQVLLFDPNATG
jgi:hydroxypyruvate reductase